MSNLVPQENDKLTAKDSIQNSKDLLNTVRKLKKTLFILDYSVSMYGGNIPDGKGGTKSKIEALKATVKELKVPPNNKLWFSSTAYLGDDPVDNIEMCGTDLKLGLIHALEIMNSREFEAIYIVSDGEPDSKEDALKQAQKINIPIHTIFIGNDDDIEAKDFMRKIATAHGGIYKDLSSDDFTIKELKSAVILALPEHKP